MKSRMKISEKKYFKGVSLIASDVMIIGFLMSFVMKFIRNILLVSAKRRLRKFSFKTDKVYINSNSESIKPCPNSFTTI